MSKQQKLFHHLGKKIENNELYSRKEQQTQRRDIKEIKLNLNLR
jgi:hypothetical protein